MTHTTQKDVQVDLQDIPQGIHPTRNNGKTWKITLALDMMFISKILLIMTTSHNIHFGTAELVKDMKTIH